MADETGRTGVGGTGNGAERDLRAPLYHRIYLVLRHQILDGAYTDGALLPSEPEIAARFGVSRITARRALDELAADGLAERRQGKGTFARVPQAMAPVEATTEGLFENLLAMGLKTTARVIAFDYRSAPPEVARVMGVEEGAEMQHAVRLRTMDGVPINHLTTWVPADLGLSFGRDDMEREPLLALLQHAGAAVESADQTITARLADAEIAPLLDTQVGAPLLRISRVVRDAEGRAVEWLIALYRPDRYQHRMHMELTRGGGGETLWEPVASPQTVAPGPG